MDERTRSPLKDPPLRLPGQSVAEKRDELWEDAVGQPQTLGMFLVLIAALEWWRFYRDMEPNPILSTAAALIVVCYAAFRIWRVRPKPRQLRRKRWKGAGGWPIS